MYLFLHIRHRLSEQLRKINGFQLYGQLPGCRLAYLKYILHHGFQALGFTFQNGNIILYMVRQPLFLLQQLHIADDGSQRRFYIMGNVGNQLHLHPLALQLFFDGLLHSSLYFIQIGYRIVEIGILRKVQGRFHIAFPDRTDLIHQIPHILRFPAQLHQIPDFSG